MVLIMTQGLICRQKGEMSTDVHPMLNTRAGHAWLPVVATYCMTSLIGSPVQELTKRDLPPAILNRGY